VPLVLRLHSLVAATNEWRHTVATKAERFQEEMMLKKHRNPPQKRSKPVAERFTHNDARRVDKRSTHAIEQTSARPSRKSTRAGSNRVKPDSAQRITARELSSSPKARASRKSGNPI
jgi:hypothetical protein